MEQRRRPRPNGGNPLQPVVDQLLETNSRLTEQIVELARVVAELRQEQVAEPVLMEASRIPLHVPESEEDAMHLFNTGQITKDELEDTLKEIGFYNAEITVPG